MTITAILWDNVLFSFNSFAETLSLINFEPKIWAISGSELEISTNTNLEVKLLLINNNNNTACYSFKDGIEDI